MTISWSVSHGLFLLQGDTLIGSAVQPELMGQVTNSHTLTIGIDGIYTHAIIKVESIRTVLLFWLEVERAGIKQRKLSITVTASSYIYYTNQILAYSYNCYL